MEIKEVVNLKSFENYLSERNYRLNTFEEGIFQDIWPFLYDFQLFFLLYDSNIPADFEWLRNSFYDKIDGKYSIYYPPGIVKANAEGDFWVRFPTLSWNGVKENPNSEFYNWVPHYYDVWKKFDQVFQMEKDYVAIYEDLQVRIIAFRLKLEKHFGKDQSQIRRFFRSGYYPNPDHSCDIIKEQFFQDYTYYCQSTRETIDMMGYNEFSRMESYYTKQRDELKRNLFLKNR